MEGKMSPRASAMRRVMIAIDDGAGKQLKRKMSGSSGLDDILEKFSESDSEDPILGLEEDQEDEEKELRDAERMRRMSRR